MNLYILRHGIAVQHGDPGYPNDADRPLTPKGERKVQAIAEAMDALDLSFDLILTSPYPRARQTAEIVAGVLKAGEKLQVSDDLTPGGSTEQLIQCINTHETQPEDVLLVGHEPYLSELISLLVAGDTSFPVVLKKGGFARLIADSLKHGSCATLAWLLTPKQMSLMT
jgi:phosphohistidine phosphatase